MKIWFTDFWPSFYKVNFILNSFGEHGINVEVTGDNPDLLFFTCFGKSHQEFSCPKVLVSAECSTTTLLPDGKFSTEFTHPIVTYDTVTSDYVISSQRPLSSKMVRFPTYGVHLDYIKYKKVNTYYDRPKTSFCSFLAGHVKPDSPRYKALQTIARYKKTDIVENEFTKGLPSDIANVIPQIESGNYILDKIDFISRYKFVLAAEHTVKPDYISEKLVDPMLVGAIPIYFGPDVNVEFSGGYALPVNDKLPDYLRYLDANEHQRKEMADVNSKLIVNKLDGFQSDLVVFYRSNFS
jgi:hypothetical protein